jgi:hypothetical protein
MSPPGGSKRQPISCIYPPSTFSYVAEIKPEMAFHFGAGEMRRFARFARIAGKEAGASNRYLCRLHFFENPVFDRGE